MQQTSRGAVVDLLEFIINNIALTSHLQELYHKESSDIMIGEGNPKDLEKTVTMIQSSITIRRDAMTKLMDMFEGNQHHWCSVKHALAAYGLAVELWYTNIQDGQFNKMVDDSYSMLMMVLSRFLNQDELEFCGRCLLDKLHGQDSK